MKVSAILTTGLLCLTTEGVSAQTVSDAQIASIVVTANRVDINAGRFAAAKGTSPEIKKFG